VAGRREPAVIAVEKARQYLMQLGLEQAAAVLDSRLEAAVQKELPYAEFLADLLGIEAGARWERYLRTRTRLAHLGRVPSSGGCCEIPVGQ